MTEYLPGLAALFVLLAANAFFVGAEFAVISARRAQIEPLADQGNRRARTALWAMEHATHMLATCQLGITASSIMILLVAEPAVHHLLEAPLAAIGLSSRVITPVAFVVTLIIVTLLHVIVGEMIPKNMAFSIPDKAVLALAPPLVAISRVVTPAIRIMNGAANAVLRLAGVEPKDSAMTAYTLDQIESIVDESTSSGMLRDASGVLSASFDFTELKVADLMVPAVGIVKVPPDAPLRDVQDLVREHGYSRYIVGAAGAPARGYVHLKDLLEPAVPGNFSARIPESSIRPMSFAAPDDDVEDTLAEMRRQGSHIFGVAGTDGKVVGYIFLEDILEKLVGEVTDSLESAS